MTTVHAGAVRPWMMLHRRRAHDQSARRSAYLPATLARNERVLAHADIAHDGVAVGTDRALHIRDGHGLWRRIAWTDVASAGWSPAQATTVVRLWPDDPRAEREMHLPTRPGFGAFAAERVSSTRLLSRHVQVTADATAHVTALREPGEVEVIWRVYFDSAGAADDGDRAVGLQRTLAELRALAVW
jgi:hypothetical protein